MGVMAEMDMIIDDAISCIIDHGMGVNEAVDATVLHYDLTPGEKRSMIYFLAQKGYRYTNKGA